MLQADGCTVNISPFRQLWTATGDCTPVYGCTTFDVTIGGYSGRHQMLVADSIDCCILGLDFLESCHCMLDIVGHVLQLQGMQIKLVPRTVPMGPMCQCIVTTERLEIKAGEDAVIPAGLTSNGRHVGFGVIEGNHRNNMAEGLILGRTLVDLEDHVLTVRVANVTGKNLKIAAGTWIANCYTVDYVEPNAPTALKVAPAPLPAHLADMYNHATEGLDVDQKAMIYWLSSMMFSPHRLVTCGAPA